MLTTPLDLQRLAASEQLRDLRPEFSDWPGRNSIHLVLTAEHFGRETDIILDWIARHKGESPNVLLIDNDWTPVKDWNTVNGWNHTRRCAGGWVRYWGTVEVRGGVVIELCYERAE